MKYHEFHPDIDKEKFLNDGYVIVDLLSEQEVAQMLSNLTSLHPDDGFDRVGGKVHCSYLDTNKEYKQKLNDLTQQIFAPKAKKLFPHYKFFYSNAFVKPPHSQETDMHGDWTTTPEPEYTTINFWCPLLDVSRENGTLELVPGSHKIVNDVFTPNAPYFFHDIEDIIKERYTVPMNLKAGQALIFDASMVHYASDNNTDTIRPVIQYVIVPKDINPVYYHFDKKHPEKGHEKFEIEFYNWYVNRNLFNVLERPVGLKSLGFVPYTERHLDEQAFKNLLKKGPEARAKLFEKLAQQGV